MVLLKETVFLIITLGGVQGQFPENTVAVVGDNVALHCAYLAKSCSQIRWQKRSASGQVANISYDDTVYDGSKYRLDNSSFCDLVIEDVQLPDNGTFICTIPGSESGSANLIVLQTPPSCSTSCISDSTVENDLVNVKCKLTYRGGGRPVMIWRNKLSGFDVYGVPSQKLDGGTLSRDFSAKAEAPEVAALVCLTTFQFDPTPGRASNDPEVRCETESCNVMPEVDDVDWNNSKTRTNTIIGASSGAGVVGLGIFAGIIYYFCCL